MSEKMKTIEGNEAAAHVAYALSEVAAIYPITPSSSMGEYCDDWAAHGRKNIFGQVLKVVEMQSEAGAAGAVHGALSAGALSTTFTASQGLLLMIPNMYKIAGELMPTVFHVSARAVAAHALSIFGDHSDVNAVRETGFSLLASASVQEVMDLALVAHLSSIRLSLPFVHFFDGFRTSMEIQKIELIDYADMAKLIDCDGLEDFRSRCMNPEYPQLRGTAQNPDIFFQSKEAANPYFARIPYVVQEEMQKVGDLTGRRYNLFDYAGDPEADRVILSMASSCDVIEETVNYLNSLGERVGLIKARLYHPFSEEHFLRALPSTVKRMAVLDRTKSPGALGEPLYRDVCTVFQNRGGRSPARGRPVRVGKQGFHSHHGQGRFRQSERFRAQEPLHRGDYGRRVAHLPGAWGRHRPCAQGHGEVQVLGSWRGRHGGREQELPSRSSVKTRTCMPRPTLPMTPRSPAASPCAIFGFRPSRIQSPYLLTHSDFIACHNPAFVTQYDILDGIREGGAFLLNSPWTLEEMESKLPNPMKRTIAQKKLKFYNIDAVKIATELGLGGRINMIMQAAFFQIAKVIPPEEAFRYIKEAIEKTYGKEGGRRR